MIKQFNKQMHNILYKSVNSKIGNVYNGHTIIEVIVSLAIFTAIIIPILTFTSKVALNTKTRDLQTAYSLLKGECDIIYKNHVLPDKKRDAKVGNITYTVFCDSEKDSVLTSWNLYVKKKKKVIAEIKGLAYIP